jgi:hypothetical protein
MSRVRVALALAIMAFTLGVSFVPHPADARPKIQTCTPNDDWGGPDDGNFEDYNCY